MTWRRLVDFISSLELTIISLSAALLLVFAGTLAQVSIGLQMAQDVYFRSFFIWWPPDGGDFKIPVFPGGHLIGAILLVNLIAAHYRRFQWGWSKAGIQLTHFGLIVMLLGGLFTDLLSTESHMRLEQGQTKNYSEDFKSIEFAVIDETNADSDVMIVFPGTRLKKGAILSHGSLPFQMTVQNYHSNSRLQMLNQAGEGAVPAASQGMGKKISVVEAPRATAMNQQDLESLIVEIKAVGNPSAESQGTWLVSKALENPERFSFGGRQWKLSLRPTRYYKPFTLTLQKFTHERYPGTEIPKNFASSLLLVDESQKEKRDVLVYMNHPLRYRGETFYQSGFEKNDEVTILQVVKNPSFLAPYVACVIVGLGLLIQFSFHFTGFLSRRKKGSQS